LLLLFFGLITILPRLGQVSINLNRAKIFNQLTDGAILADVLLE